MKKRNLVLLIILNLFIYSGLASGMDHEIKIFTKEGLDKYLTDAEGKTLYWFAKDSPGKSACAGGCLAKWPIYYRETLAAPQGTAKEDFGTITRDGGRKQTIFRGYPLYYWIGDAKAGDTTGQGVGNVWFVVNPDKFPPRKSAY